MQITNRTKAFMACLLSLCLMCGCLCAPVVAFAREPLKIVTTIFPPYDFARQIAGDVPVELKMLLAPGAESHSFEPSPQDIIAIQDCDMFIYAGGEGDAWVDRILESMDTRDMSILAMVDMVNTVDEEIVEGMEHSHEEEFDPDKVYDRTLTEWTGAWKSLAPYLDDGSLDTYVQSKADEDGTSFAERMEQQKSSWRTDDFDTFMIAGSKAYVDTGAATYSGTYDYEGYAILEKDTGASVWYQYALTEDAEGMPKYIAFNDHGYGTPPEGEEAEMDGHDHDHGVAHTHLRYGDDSLEELVSMEGWSTFFVDAAATTEEIIDTLMGHSGHSHEHEVDEHVWTSPANAKLIARRIADEMARLDSANAGTFEANLATFTGELQSLDAAFQRVVDSANRHTILFGDRFPFRYLADAYSLAYYAAFSGCSTSTDASAGTIAALIDKAREEALPVVFKIELSNGLIADTVAESAGAKVLEMHSAHNLTKADFDAGVTYIDVMLRNVAQLEEALK